MDTTKLEYTAEDLIAHVLQRSGILVAKPKFDREGADLLAFAELADGVKFCRIQCKGRTITDANSTNVKIPRSYVSPSLVVFLYVDSGELQDVNLYCFFSSDIEQWSILKDDFVLSIPGGSFQRKLKFYKFNSTKIGLIKAVIANAEAKGEFRRIVYGSGNLVVSPARITGSCEVTPKKA